ncbi:sodium/calcium exchanger 3-like isoform X2 [Anastrepha obliqua]|uniref:sodium/calcium exchanger 3-like isoform X2 n=1 Tax=Anastrepha obliqua TaxID=95512 RepID=UPI002409A6F2|nr:sodium/calcium exchanger 3-like isoform X2 [Anastrepha obliqua]
MKRQFVARNYRLDTSTNLGCLICLICLLADLIAAQKFASREIEPYEGPSLYTPTKKLDEVKNVQPIEGAKDSPPTPEEAPKDSPPFTEVISEPREETLKLSNQTALRSDYDRVNIICKDGLVLRAWQPLEGISLTERITRGLVYFLAMCYIFIGIAIISGRFMESIEVITSSERRVNVINRNGQREKISVRVWSNTVANLTLMALGSSMPEILLSIIEMFQKNFEAGDIGPGAIVGSAAFNLFIIIAICIIVVPKGQTRRIQNYQVFIVTAIWSIFAYVWLCLITKYITPSVIDVWEGLVTFFCFPTLVYHAYLTEHGYFCAKCYKPTYEMNQSDSFVWPAEHEANDYEAGTVRSSLKDLVESPEMREFEETRRQYIVKVKELHRRYPEYDLEIIEALAQEQLIHNSSKSIAFHRVQTGRYLTGSTHIRGKVRQYVNEKIGEAKTLVRKKAEEDAEFDDDFETHIYFAPCHYTVLESVGEVELHVIRAGSLKQTTKVEYQTEDGTAEAGRDYVASIGVLNFPQGIKKQTIKITIIDDDVYEEDVHFYVHLKNPSGEAALVSPHVATIMILDDDHCGIFGFKQIDHEIPESVKIYNIEVKRYFGASSKVIVPYFTKEKTALSGKEYMNVNGELVFQDGQVVKAIEVEIIDEHCFEKDVVFEVYLGRPRVAAGQPLYAKLKEIQQKPDEERSTNENILLKGLPKLVDKRSKIECHIIESGEFKQTVNKLVQTANASKLIGTTTWKEQLLDALTISGRGNIILEDIDGIEEENHDEELEEELLYGGCQYVMHFLSIFWKVCFAVIPPSKMYCGYPCFFISVGLIAVCSTVLVDVTSLFGCTLGVRDSVTAICFVALGTSLPDAFASKLAAIHDKTADNAIGNITGSNAVNVFLGIGIAWTLAAVYHACHGEKFIVPVGSLLFSTVLYLFGALIAFFILLYRRKKSIGGELGGVVKLKWFHGMCFIFMWIIYLVISTLEAYHIIPGF